MDSSKLEGKLQTRRGEKRQVPKKTVLSLTSLTVGEKSPELENDQGKTVRQHREVIGNAQHKRNDFRVAQIDSVTFMIALQTSGEPGVLSREAWLWSRASGTREVLPLVCAGAPTLAGFPDSRSPSSASRRVSTSPQPS